MALFAMAYGIMKCNNNQSSPDPSFAPATRPQLLSRCKTAWHLPKVYASFIKQPYRHAYSISRISVLKSRHLMNHKAFAVPPEPKKHARTHIRHHSAATTQFESPSTATAINTTHIISNLRNVHIWLIPLLLPQDCQHPLAVSPICIACIGLVHSLTSAILLTEVLPAQPSLRLV